MKLRATVFVSLLALVLTGACVSTSGPQHDAWIQEQVSAKIANDVSLEGQQIQVAVENGQVLLTGTISERAQRTKAIALAGSVSGVTSVLDRLRLVSA